MNSEKTHEGEFEIDLGKLFRYYLKHWISIAVSGLAVALIALLITVFAITPMYRSSVTVYVNNSKNTQTDTLTGGNLSAAVQLVRTYVNIIESKPILEEVAQVGQLDYTVEELREIISAKQVDDTEMFVVSAVHPDAEMAAHIVNTIAEVAPDRIAEIVEGSSAKIVEYADPAEKPYSPSLKKNLLLGALLGCVLMGIVRTLQYLFDMCLEDEEDITMYFDAPVLGLIPDFNQTGKKRKNGYSVAAGYQKGEHHA